LDLKVVAEGVETEAQLLLLRDLQCDYIQGYLISKAVTSEEATRLLAEPAIVRNKVMHAISAGADPLIGTNHSTASQLIGVLNSVR
jgi:predicted signal transduction protein with EAL and GGDEF domain